MYKRLLAVSLLLNIQFAQASLLPSGEDAKRTVFFATVSSAAAGLSTWAVNRWTGPSVPLADYKHLRDGAREIHQDLDDSEASSRKGEVAFVGHNGSDSERISNLEKQVARHEQAIGKPGVRIEGQGDFSELPTGFYMHMDEIREELGAVQADLGNPARKAARKGGTVTQRLDSLEKRVGESDAGVKELKEKNTALARRFEDYKVVAAQIQTTTVAVLAELDLSLDPTAQVARRGAPMHERVKAAERSIGKLDEEVGTLFDDIGIPERRSRSVNDGETIAARMQKVESQQKASSQSVAEFALWMKDVQARLNPVIDGISTQFEANGSAVESAAERDLKARIATVESDLTKAALDANLQRVSQQVDRLSRDYELMAEEQTEMRRHTDTLLEELQAAKQRKAEAAKKRAARTE